MPGTGCVVLLAGDEGKALRDMVDRLHEAGVEAMSFRTAADVKQALEHFRFSAVVAISANDHAVESDLMDALNSSGATVLVASTAAQIVEKLRLLHTGE